MSSLLEREPAVPEAAQRQAVNDYFNQTHDDYRWLWGIDRHWGLHCGYFDALHRTHRSAVVNMNRVLAATARIRPTDHVIDAGCGIGGSSLWLARTVGCRVTGVNINAMHLDVARRLAEREKLTDRVDFRLADYCRTKLPSESYDVVWALESFCYAADKPAFLREAYSLLRPGGRLIIADGFLTRSELTDDEQAIVQGWHHGWAIPNVATLDQMHQWLAGVGFRDVKIRDITANVTPSSIRIYALTVLLAPLGRLLNWLGLRSDLQTRGIESGYYQYHARRQGLGVYELISAAK